jgi:DNA-binding beta-propeller fold protein YncE
LAGPSAIAVDTNKDILYVASQGDPTIASDDSLFAFSNASQAQGNISSHRTICSPSALPPCPDTRLNNPAGLFIDADQNHLYVSNTMSFLPIIGAVTASKGSATITGAGTTFQSDLIAGERIRVGSKAFTVLSVESNTSLTLTSSYSGDSISGTPLFETDCSDARTPCNTILVFHNADLIDDNAIPSLVLSSPDLNDPRGLTVDLNRKRLYVANAGGQSIVVFKNVDGLNGTLSVNADAEIGGALTRIHEPVGVAIDSNRDILYVLNQGTSEILVFEQASSLNGNVPPARIISGSNLLNRPTSIYLDPDNDLLYVADEPLPPAGQVNPNPPGAIYIFTQASAAQGQADHKTLTGTNTGLNQPVALFVDTTR